MKTPLAILTLALSTISLVACGASQTRVISDNSVAHQFAAFNKNGWSVTGGDIPNPQRRQVSTAQSPQTGNGPVNNPFANAVWKTNFRVDDPNVPKPKPVAPTSPAQPAAPAPPTSVGGFVLPPPAGTAASPPSTDAPDTPESHDPAPKQ